MKLGKICVSAALLWLTAANAQGPVSDNVIVNFSNPVMVGDHRIESGEYLIKQLPSASNPRMLEFSNGKGTKVQVTIAAWAALDNLNRHDTKVQLDTANGAQYVKRIWVEGQAYGYELPAPHNNMGTLEARNQGMRLTGTYRPTEIAQSTPAPVTTTETQTRRSTTDNADIAQATPVPATPPPATPEPATPPPATTDNKEPQTIAQATPPPATTEPQTAAPATTQARTMPSTASNWAGMLMAGLMMAGAGLAIHRFYR